MRNWSSTGDCAHEPHIRKLIATGSHLSYSREQGTHSVAGSKFIDMLGSTEMGHSAFFIAHRLGHRALRPVRRQGLPVRRGGRCWTWPPASRCRPAQVGHVGLKSPTLALGYWNDSVNTFRTRLNGYYLTGDLMYQDAEGYYYHVDRASDALELGGGNWLYTALSEERILAQCPDVRDCSVIAARGAGRHGVTEVLLVLAAGRRPRRSTGNRQVRAALGEAGGGHRAAGR